MFLMKLDRDIFAMRLYWSLLHISKDFGRKSQLAGKRLLGECLWQGRGLVYRLLIGQFTHTGRAGHRGCRRQTPLPWTTGRPQSWHFPQCRCRGWCFWQKDRFDVNTDFFFFNSVNTTECALAHLPMSMQRSPRMLPGLESAGLVSPSIILANFTMFCPSHTWNTHKTVVGTTRMASRPKSTRSLQTQRPEQ